MKTVVRSIIAAMLAMPLAVAQAQQGPPPGPPPVAATLAFKVEWVRPASQEDTKVRYMPVQENIADPNVVMTFYGKAAKQILTTSAPGNPAAPYGVWCGTAEGPFAVTFKRKDALLDMTGLANIRWQTKTSGFHAVRPVVKLANGTLLIGDLSFESVAKLSLHEFSLLNIRWIKLDPERIVTVTAGPAVGNPNPGIWVPSPDLSKVDEIGFADLMPGSGHGQGGYIQIGGIEVNSKTVPRAGS
jgi:hypothetical protein